MKANSKEARNLAMAVLLLLFASSISLTICSIIAIRDARGGVPLLVISLILLLALILLLFAAIFLFRLGMVRGAKRDFVFKAPHNELKDRDNTAEEVAEEAKENSIFNKRWFEGKVHEEMDITSADGLKLHAYILPSEASSDKWVLCVHGYTSNALDMLDYGRAFYEQGYNVLLPDMRGHGKSEGKYLTMGWPDRLDILRWIDEVIKRDEDAKILLFGISMGAAAVMMTAGEDLPSNVKIAIEDCGYTSVFDEFAYQLKSLFHLPPFPLLYLASFICRLRCGFWMDEASALEQVRASRVPMLFIHGAADTFVPFSMLMELSSACRRQSMRTFFVSAAGHGGCERVFGRYYWDEVFRFIEEYWSLIP